MTHREGHVKTEAENRMIWLQAKDCGQQPEAKTEGMERSSLHPEETNPENMDFIL